MELIPFNVDQVIFFLLIFVRISTIIALLPVFGSWSIPFQLKIGLSLLLAVILFGSVMSTGIDTTIPFSPGLFIMLIIKEVMVGLAIGFVSSMLFTAVQFAGLLIDTEMGFGFVAGNRAGSVSGHYIYYPFPAFQWSLFSCPGDSEKF
jgi:flagellar biosynthetic protein FliR